MNRFRKPLIEGLIGSALLSNRERRDVAIKTLPGTFTIATIVGVRESAQRSVREALVEFLWHREMQLVLDTCEHLIDAWADLVDALLREAPGLRVVATRRKIISR